MYKKIKRYLVPACIAAVAVVVLLVYWLNKGAPAIDASGYLDASSSGIQTSELSLKGNDGRVPGMQLAAETNELALYFNPDTTEFAVRNKQSGKVWRSNPEAREEDPIASPYEKEVMGSQFTITFRDTMGYSTTFANYTESVARGQFKAEAVENGFKVTYTLGNMELGIDALPKRISKERMEEKVLSKLDEAKAKYVSTRYMAPKDNPDVLERLDTAVARELVLKRMLEAFAEAGYTPEDLAYDNEAHGISGGAAGNKPNFVVPLLVQLEGDSLVVTVPAGELEESEGYRIRTINLLSFFGAAGMDEQGYMLVPDGSGSLIYLNNGKTNQEVYAQRIYGEDENDNRRRRGQVAQAARLPVFGLKSGGEAWYAAITKGDGIAAVNADVSGRNNSYNQVYAGFALRGEDTLELYKGDRVEDIQLLSDQLYKGDLQIRYQFLSGTDADYSGMAKDYRETLERQGDLTPLTEQADLPFYVSVLGAVDKRKTFLGVPYQGIVPLTTFEQAGEMADRLRQDGVSNVHMRYLGWFNDGLNHEIPSSVKVEHKLGSVSDLRKLSGKLEQSGGKLYPDVAFQHVFQKDGPFAPASDAARFITREEAARTPYNRAFHSMDTMLGTYYLLSPAKLPHYVDKFMNSYAKVNNSGLALRDLGDKLHADYRVNRVIFRESAKSIVEEQLDKLSGRYDDLMITGGNAYALKYADHLINAPLGASGFAIADEEVPFFQMVLHGYLDYAGEPVNLSEEQDAEYQLLKSIELGAAPHFLWTNESSSKLKFTPYDTMYSTEYSAWYDTAVEMYRQAGDVLSELRTVKMERHIRHGKDVAEVRYENGVTLYVNYSDQPVTVGGVRIDPKNFTAGGGSE